MTDAPKQMDGNFPVFELGYSGNSTGGPEYLRSSQGKLFVRLPVGSAFTWMSLRIISSRILIKLKYRFLYKQPGTDLDLISEISDSQESPQVDSRYIKGFVIESKVYYRCWLSRDQHPDEYEREPAGAFWHYSGQYCGATEDNRWITALEIRMPPLLDGWRAA
jgi:hypothetical protein